MVERPRRYTCGSKFDHDANVLDDVRHYFWCLTIERRGQFFDSLSDEKKQPINDEIKRICKLRERFEAEGASTKAGKLVIGIKKDLSQWRKRPLVAPLSEPDAPDQGILQNSKEKGKEAADTAEDDLDINVSMIWYKNGHPWSNPKYPNQFPAQKHSLHKLLHENDKDKNPLMLDLEDDEFRWLHIPANNMDWVEEAIARYYKEDRPDLDRPFEKPKHDEPSSKSMMLLRPQFWRGLQHGTRSDLPVHTRHMRPRCYDISTDPFSIQKARNLALFMPYMHWETDRWRARAAKVMKSATKRKNTSMFEVVDKRVTFGKISESQRVTTDEGLETIRTKMNKRPVGNRSLLGQILFRVAALKEQMDFDTDEKLIRRYINHRPPLHPRRTLDQFYYWTLKDTENRDRDQVIWRATNFRPELLQHTCNPKDKKKHEACMQCREIVRKVPRVVMVDNLWMWLLDSKTILTAFPRRFGRNKPDPSAVQRCIRTRLENARDNEVRSIFDLAIIIIDQCGRVFFDRTQSTDHQPQVMDSFANAIGKVTAQKTIAFDDFWEYTRLASAKYNARGQEEWAASKAATLLSINPEGKLLREIKDISEELYIMMLIKTQQKDVIKTFIKQVADITGWRNAVPGTPRGSPRPSSRHSEQDATVRTPSFVGRRPTLVADDAFDKDLDWTMNLAENLMESIQDQFAELDNLKKAAEHTETALKELLSLKQQQANIVQAGQAVELTAQTLRQGRSIMLFTIVTIVFLPLGFFSSIFGMNAKEINDSHWTLHEEFKYMIPISFLVITISLLVAFSSLLRALLSFPFRIIFTYIATRIGLYTAWEELSFSSGWIKRKEHELLSSWKLQSKKDKIRRDVLRMQEKDKKEAQQQNPTSVKGRAAIAAAVNGAEGIIAHEDVEKFGNGKSIRQGVT